MPLFAVLHPLLEAFPLGLLLILASLALIGEIGLVLLGIPSLLHFSVAFFCCCLFFLKAQLDLATLKNVFDLGVNPLGQLLPKGLDELIHVRVATEDSAAHEYPTFPRTFWYLSIVMKAWINVFREIQNELAGLLLDFHVGRHVRDHSLRPADHLFSPALHRALSRL